MRATLPFDAATVALQGTNLIEASAGTGKTYSIAIMAVRLIIEKKLSVKEILMVTFTNAAVAELEERIRLFIRQAYQVSLGQSIDNDTITTLVKSCADEAITKTALRDAVLFLDETSVLTIHSFCQKTLNEFAFETNQLFGADTVNDMGRIIESEVNKYWREQITILPTVLLAQLITLGLSRQSIQKVVAEHISGKRYFVYDHTKNYTVSQQDYPAMITLIEEIQLQNKTNAESLTQYVKDNKAQIKATCTADKSAKKYFLPLIDEPTLFIDSIVEKRDKSKYVKQIFSDILSLIDEQAAKQNENNNKLQIILSSWINFAIQYTIKGIEAYKLRTNQMSFDDMIVKLHNALVVKQNDTLILALQNKYKAVYIDEFQDTDRLQYELFDKAFGSDTILFYIGDPKQSIYAWRKADMATYFAASDAVSNLYSMNENFRSSAPMIAAMNYFFKPTADFDTFYFNGANHAINYIAVASPTNNTKGVLYQHAAVAKPITITTQANNKNIEANVALHVVELLQNNKYQILQNNTQRNIIISDIGILVKTHKQGYAIKAALHAYGIPAITIGDDKVLKSAEAEGLYYLLAACYDISQANINRALYSSFTRFSKQAIAQLDDEVTLHLFKKYKTKWQQAGIYTALIEFISDFNVQINLLQNNTLNGERVMANLIHLIELLHKIQTTKQMAPLELLSWLRRAIDGMHIVGDEYEQRVENDEDAIKIVTIHKSKGLEYNIVFAPFLDLHTVNEFSITSFRDEQTGQYVSVQTNQLTVEQVAQWALQQEQENRRLIYVAITRAVYKCYIYKNTSNTGKYKYATSSLASFTTALVNADPLLIEQINEPSISPVNYTYTSPTAWQPLVHINTAKFVLAQQNWAKLSYTYLAVKPTFIRRPIAAIQTDSYDNFVNNLLIKGENTGNLLHYILEKINYSNSTYWNDVITAAINQFAPFQKSIYLTMLPELIAHIMQATIQVVGSSFTLASVLAEKIITELEFDFAVGGFNSDNIIKINNPTMAVKVRYIGTIEGIMNGKIDLFFEHEGKYYILDWKSNYLGDSPFSYEPAALADAMNDNNYHLQYLIYTVAIKKYLSYMLPNFNYETQFGGVLYIFLRGVRNGYGTGIYYAKPTLEQIKRVEDIF